MRIRGMPTPQKTIRISITYSLPVAIKQIPAIKKTMATAVPKMKI